MSKRNKRKRTGSINKKRVSIFLTIVIIIPCFSLFLRRIRTVRETFFVREMEIEGIEQLKPDDVLSMVDLKKSKTISLSSSEKMVEKLKKNIWIENAFVRRGVFGRLIIEIKERKPVAILRNNTFAILCSDGKIIPYSEKNGFTDLPSVYIERTENLASYVTLIRKIWETFEQKPITIYFKSGGKTLVKVDGFSVIIGKYSPFLLGTVLNQTFSVKELFKIFDEVKNEGYTICDMRFNNELIFEKGGAL